MKTSQWIPRNTIKAREDIERMLTKETIRVEEKDNFKIDLKLIHPTSLFSKFLALFSKKY